MSLHIQTLQLDEFRGYSHLELSDLGALTVIAGPNAVGKTNIIEAIQLLCSATSFRKPTWSQTISWGAATAHLRALFVDGKRRIEHTLAITGNERRYEVNGKRKTAAAVRGTCPCVLFIPDDLQMVKASSAKRRGALDDLGTQLSKGYALLKGDYAQVVRQRNLLIKEGVADPVLFESWNESLAVAGARLCVNRWRLAARLFSHLSTIHEQLAEGQRLEVRYLPSWERFDDGGRQLDDAPVLAEGEVVEVPSVDVVEARLLECMHRFSDAEFRRGTSLFGPHKDEVAFFIDGRNARLFASQGQQRTLVLAWKLAEVELVADILDQQPLLLLDDVMSELDEQHRRSLGRFVEHSAQTFMTTANLGYFSEEVLSRADVIEVPIAGTRHTYSTCSLP